jgi:hypothetical protein
VRRTRIRVPASRRLRSLTAALLVTTAAGGIALLTACDSSTSNDTSGPTSGGPPTTSNFSGALPSQLSSLASAAQGSASAAVSSAKAAASSFEASVEAGASSAAAAFKSELDAVSGKGNAISDVQLTGLPKAQTGGLTAVVVNITNSTDKKASYAVEVEFADSSGKVVDTTIVGAHDVAAGKKAQPVAFTTKDTDATLFPRVAKAVRF